MVSRHFRKQQGDRGLGQTESVLSVKAHSLCIVEHLNVKTYDQTGETGCNGAVK